MCHTGKCRHGTHACPPLHPITSGLPSECRTERQVQKDKIYFYLENREGLDEEGILVGVLRRKPRLSSLGTWGGFERVEEMRSCAVLWWGGCQKDRGTRTFRMFLSGFYTSLPTLDFAKRLL